MTTTNIVSEELRAELLGAIRRYMREKNQQAELSAERAQNCLDLIDTINEDHVDSMELINSVNQHCQTKVLTGFVIAGVRFSTGRSYLINLIQEVIKRFPREICIEHELVIAKDRLHQTKTVEIVQLQQQIEALTHERDRARELCDNLRETLDATNTELREVRMELRAIQETGGDAEGSSSVVPEPSTTPPRLRTRSISIAYPPEGAGVSCAASLGHGSELELHSWYAHNAF